MFEKVNPSHPDKVADRIAGALVDMAYAKDESPKIAVEVLIGHGKCHIIAETNVQLDVEEINEAVQRIAGQPTEVDYHEVPQDSHLAYNQSDEIRCGDNGIFRGTPVTIEQCGLSNYMRKLYEKFPYDGKAVVSDGHLTLCQSNATNEELKAFTGRLYDDPTINPLGDWTGGTDVDTGATNRKLGSDMGDAVTGGGLHGKDLSKSDASVNIACHLLAQKSGMQVTASCAIGDDRVEFEYADGMGAVLWYRECVEMAREHIDSIGGFERFAEWGLV